MLIIDVIDDDRSPNWSAAELIEEVKRLQKALNQTADKAASRVRADLPQRFTMRNQWTRKGIRADLASGDDLEARVFSVDGYMVKQQDGETWKPDGHVAIPKTARRSAKSLIPRGMFPNALRGRKDVFKFDFSQNPSWKPYPHVGIFQRVMNGKHFRILYLLKDQKNTKPLWHFDDQVEATVDHCFDRYHDELASTSDAQFFSTRRLLLLPRPLNSHVRELGQSQVDYDAPALPICL
ncbi:hypothetical protein [Oligoflexus tunisiensis]|uniref:hypothetical protein n=1 Tax=Oligoflexus tunisiensis TaxID=708132 RepID=UPI00114D0ECB|nr:hypothetical protein [Oligoflexus tunisiensis]